jgi:hypothetical protein
MIDRELIFPTIYDEVTIFFIYSDDDDTSSAILKSVSRDHGQAQVVLSL